MCEGVQCDGGYEWDNAVFPIGVAWYLQASELVVSETFAREFAWEQHILQMAAYASPAAPILNCKPSFSVCLFTETMPLQAPLHAAVRVESEIRFTVEPLLWFRQRWCGISTSVSGCMLVQALMRHESYTRDVLRVLHGFVRETRTLQFIGEWSAEVLEFIPYIYSLKKRNKLNAKILTYSGMRP